MSRTSTPQVRARVFVGAARRLPHPGVLHAHQPLELTDDPAHSTLRPGLLRVSFMIFEDRPTLAPKMFEDHERHGRLRPELPLPGRPRHRPGCRRTPRWTGIPPGVTHHERDPRESVPQQRKKPELGQRLWSAHVGEARPHGRHIGQCLIDVENDDRRPFHDNAVSATSARRAPPLRPRPVGDRGPGCAPSRRTDPEGSRRAPPKAPGCRCSRRSRNATATRTEPS